jgi:uroporphyrinogen-III synthase
MTDAKGKVPILLLKTRSTPADAYHEHLSAAGYEPVFVPVLEHRCKQDVLDQVRGDITGRAFLPDSKYGAIIFTSQRAVEAFAKVVEDIRQEGTHSLDELLPESLPLYVVGPATARGLRALNLRCPILGEDTGNGEALSVFILEHYNSLYNGPGKPSILFLVGDKRRDIIPKTLQADYLAVEKRSQVEELVVYETGEMLSFKDDFSLLWRKNMETGNARQWVVVFSPTGCKAMLESLGLIDEQTGRFTDRPSRKRDIRIATIGPTTRDYLISEFGFTPDVCADVPSAEGIAEGIKAFVSTSG